MTSSASVGIGTPPLLELIFAMPAMPTKAYIGPTGRSQPKIGARSLPTTKLLPGLWWSTPDGSNITCSCPQRIGQSTFHTSLPFVKSVPHEEQKGLNG